MTPPANTARYKNHRLPGALLRHGVGRYSRLTLSSRDVPERLCARGIAVTSEAIRPWGHKCGQPSANQRRRRRPRPGDTWPLEAVLVTSHGTRRALGRTVEQDATGRASLVPSQRQKQAAQQCCHKWLKGRMYVPRMGMTDKRKSDGAAQCEILPGVAHRPRWPLLSADAYRQAMAHRCA